MPLCSAFTPCGQLECSSRPSVAETVYRSIVANLGGQYDLTIGGHNEATVYARARSIARAMQAQRRGANNALPLKCVELLPLQETGYGLVPGESDDLLTRQRALAARMQLSRGATRENVETQLRAILGAAFLGYRTLAPGEVTSWPATPAAGPGIFPRVDGAIVPKYIRLTDPVTQTGLVTADSYSESNQDADAALQDTVGADFSAAGQSFLGNGGAILKARWYLKKTGTAAGFAVARIYAASGLLGSTSIPTGAPLATSAAFDVSTLSAVSHALVDFAFTGVNQITLAMGTAYVVTVEYSSGTGGNLLQVGIDFSASTHRGNFSSFAAGAWTAGAFDACFYVMTSLRVGYAQLDPTQVQAPLVAGDIMTVQLETLGLAERVTVVSVGVDAIGPFLTATFANAHDVGASAIVGSVPVWMSTQRFAFIEVTAAAINNELVRKVNDLMSRIARGVSQWAIVQPTTPGATTMGPFTLGLSPLGAVPVGSLAL